MQEYELAFVTTLPRQVKVVDPSTLDFAKSPLGSLAFRYKHGWILINPLIPSRGKSGGGLARWHGHKSGGFTTGRFHKGADGKIKFKAEKAYGSKEEWQQEVAGKAAAVGAKQAAAKESVDKAETATNHAAQLEADNAPKEALAAAHAEAAQAHQDAAKKYEAMGQGGLKSGILTHSAHSAIHASKATKLEQEAKAEKAAKLEQRKAAATQLTANANDISAKAKGSEGLPKDKAALHQEAAEAHKAAQLANEKAGNKYVAEAHGAAVAKHEKIAKSQQATHESMVKAADTLSGDAAKASKSATISSEEKDTLVSQIAAHKKAADVHGQAATAHANLWDKETEQHHQEQKAKHTAKAQELQTKQQARDKAQAKADELGIAASEDAEYAEKHFSKTDKAPAAYQKVSEQYQKAAVAAKAAHNPDDAAEYEATSKDYAQKAVEAKQTLREQAADQQEKAAIQAALKAGGLGETPEAVQAHKDATKEFLKAEKAAKKAGSPDAAKDFHENAVAHLDKSVAIKQKLQEKAELKAKADETSAKAKQASEAAKSANTPAAHDAALNEHAKAWSAAKKAGLDSEAQYHKEQAKAHAEAEKQIKQAEEATSKAITATQQAAKADTVEAHLKAAREHEKAAEVSQATGMPMVDYHKKTAAQHVKDAEALKGGGASEDDSASLGEKAFAATEGISKIQGDKEKAAAHTAAAQAHAEAATAADKAGLAKKAQQHKDYAKLHLADAKKLQGDSAATEKAAQVPTPPSVTSDDKPLKPVGSLKDTGKVLGTHGSKLMEDEAGNKWLNKSDSQGYARALDPAVAALHRKAGMETPVFVKTKDGHLQGMLPGSKEAFPNGSFNPEALSEDDVIAMLQHQVMDHATGNQDSHSGQWLKTADGKLMQIDQGQAFKFGVGDDPTKTYPPLGSDVPVYPKLWNAAKAGKVQIPDPNGDNDFAKAIQAVQDMPDDQFKAMFKPYAVQALKNGHNPGGHTTVDGFLDDIAQHKNNIGKDFEKLYNGLPDSAKAGKGETPDAGGLTPKQQALKAVAEYSHNPGEDWSLKKYQSLKKAASEAGATPSEMNDAIYSPEQFLKSLPAQTRAPSAPAPAKASGTLSPSGHALKALAKYGSDTPAGQVDAAKQKELVDAAKAAGATDTQITNAISKPTAYYNAYEKASKLASKEEALKAVATHALVENDAAWNAQDHTALKNAALAHGATMEEYKEALQTPDEYLAKQPAPQATATTASPAATAPAAPQADPYKPKAKWSKVKKGVKVGGEIQEVDAVEGPKGLAIHKATSGSGWTVSTADGLKLGGHNFKTQKEAKLAAEWVANNFDGGTFDSESFKKWKDENPEGFTKLKQGIATSQWNKDAAAAAASAAAAAPTPSGAAGLAKKPSTPIGTTGWKKTAHPKTGDPSIVHPASGFHITKTPYGQYKLTTPDGTSIGTYSSQSQAKGAAMILGNEDFVPTGSKYFDEGKLAKWAAAYGKDSKEYKDAAAAFQTHHGSDPNVPDTAPVHAPTGSSPAQKITFTGLSNDKAANAALMKQLYDQATGPNATAADKAEYAKAQEAWKSKHSTGEFDPTKYLPPGQLPAPGSTPNPQFGKPKYPVKKGSPGWKPYNPTEGSTYGQATTDRAELAEITKKQWSASTYELGYRNASYNESIHGDWKPKPEHAGPGSGPYIYSTGSYTSINQQLRGDKKAGIEPFGATGGKWDDVIADMDRAFDDVPPLDRNIVVSRKMYGPGPFPKAPPPMKPGEEYVDLGYNSTSKSREVWSGDTHMEIRLPKGSKVLDLNHTHGSDNSTEQEILLNRNSKFRVVEDTTSTYKGQNVRHIVVELVP